MVLNTYVVNSNKTPVNEISSYVIKLSSYFTKNTEVLLIKW